MSFVDAKPPQRPRRNRMQLVYFALAAFDFLTISFTLFLSHQTITAYQEAAERSGAWAERAGAVAQLGNLARQTNAPGNDVFDTNNVAVERSRRDSAFAAFDAKWREIAAEVNANVDARDRPPILDALNSARSEMEVMLQESDGIFAQLEQGRANAAGRRMATMDRIYGRLTASILEAISEVQVIQARHQAEQLAAAQDVRRLELVILGLMLMIVVGVALYGYKINEVMQQADERLEAANAALQHYADNVAHELRTPINRMMMGADVVLSRPREGEEYHEALQANLEEAERLSSIVEALLFLANATNFPRNLSRQTLDVGAELALIGEFFEVSAEQAGVKLEVKTDPGLSIAADRVLLHRAISNLVSNALSHTPAGGRIEIQARAGAEGAAITVRDTGPGIPAQDQAHVFERFYRADRIASPEGRMGLGLPITKSIMDMHGGVIALESQPGDGTAITLTFPVLARTPEAIAT